MAGRRYLLDTSILSNLIEDPTSPLAERVIELSGEEFCTSIIAACELRYGAAKKGSPSLTKTVDRLLARIDILPLEPGADQHYGDIRASLERIGQPIGGNDLLIAAQSRALGLVLVTGNAGEFGRVPNLRVENWLEPGG